MVEIDMQDSLDYSNENNYESLNDSEMITSHEDLKSNDSSKNSHPYNSSQAINKHEQFSSHKNRESGAADDFGQFVNDEEEHDNQPYIQPNTFPAALQNRTIDNEKTNVKRRKSVNKAELKDASLEDSSKRKSAMADSVETLVRRFKIFFPRHRPSKTRSTPSTSDESQEVSEQPQTNLRNFSFATSKIGRQFDEFTMGSPNTITDADDDPMEYGNIGIGNRDIADQSGLSGATQAPIASEQSKMGSHNNQVDDPYFSGSPYQSAAYGDRNAGVLASDDLDMDSDHLHHFDDFEMPKETAPNFDDIPEDYEKEETVTNAYANVDHVTPDSFNNAVADNYYNHNAVADNYNNDNATADDNDNNAYAVADDNDNNAYAAADDNYNEPEEDAYISSTEDNNEDEMIGNRISTQQNNDDDDDEKDDFHSFDAPNENHTYESNPSPQLSQRVSVPKPPTNEKPRQSFLENDRALKVFKSPEVEEVRKAEDLGTGKKGGGVSDAWKRISSYFSLKKEKVWSVDDDNKL